MSDPKRWCFTWLAMGPADVGKTRAALLLGAKWPPGSKITISFLDGDPTVQDRVRTAAQEWVIPGMANLLLDFRKNTTETQIRISFRYSGSWSVLGTTCRQITDRTKPTMNFGWLTPATPDAETRRVVLHEFGHALGLIHEHQNPAGGIQWDREAVIADLSGPPNNWSLEVIEQNMFKPYGEEETNYTKTDGKSIMMYPIPPHWTKNGFSVGLNSELSGIDKQFIKQQYH